VKFLGGLGDRLSTGLRRSREYLAGQLAAVLEPDRPIDDALYAELEEVLIAADLGAALGCGGAVERLVAFVHRGPSGALVERVEVFEEDEEGLTGFAFR